MKKRNKVIIISLIAVVLIAGIILTTIYFNKTTKPIGQNETNLIIVNQVGVANPSATYCAALGYKGRTNETEAGQVGICILPYGIECTAWNFYRGKCGQEWSYCAKKGYDLKNLTDNEGWGEGAICINKTTKEEAGNVFDLVNAEFTLQNNMKS